MNFSQKKLYGGNSGIPSERFNKDITISKELNTYKYCHLSKKVLQKPVVSDYLGNLYNKVDLLQYLINKKRKGANRETTKEKRDVMIASLNDVVELNIELEHEKGILRCLVSDVQVNINNDSNVALTDVLFSYIVPCGCTMNTKVLKSLVDLEREADEKRKKQKCPFCSHLFNVTDVIDINNCDIKIRKGLEKRMDRLKEEGKYHNLKKMKGGKKHNSEQEQEGTNKKRTLETADPEDAKSNPHVHKKVVPKEWNS